MNCFVASFAAPFHQRCTSFKSVKSYCRHLRPLVAAPTLNDAEVLQLWDAPSETRRGINLLSSSQTRDGKNSIRSTADRPPCFEVLHDVLSTLGFPKMLISLTVGKVDAGVAVLLTEDKRLVRSSTLLPFSTIDCAVLTRPSTTD